MVQEDQDFDCILMDIQCVVFDCHPSYTLLMKATECHS